MQNVELCLEVELCSELHEMQPSPETRSPSCCQGRPYNGSRDGNDEGRKLGPSREMHAVGEAARLGIDYSNRMEANRALYVLVTLRLGNGFLLCTLNVQAVLRIVIMFLKRMMGQYSTQSPPTTRRGLFGDLPCKL